MAGADGQPARPVVYVVSDSLGETAELVVRAAITQFNQGTAAEVRRVPYIDTADAVRDVVARARRPCLIVYTLIHPDLRRLLAREAEAAGIPSVDVMGPVMEALRGMLKMEPRLEPGLIHRLDEQYFSRIEAIEFTVRCDDGKDLHNLSKADVVLIGVSRTSKTPVSMYLANRNLKVANVPLVPEVEPPAALFRLPPGRVVGLTIQPEKLQQIRLQRLRKLGAAAAGRYGDPERIREELAYAEQVFRRIGCPVIDVTNKAVEETAAEVMQILNKGAFGVGYD
ncbi:MAG: pyruvate, water dikinase regulatory protein [Bacillota bacterium]|nr:phosphoenolpyruvate synthase regulatory protein [Bacillota bacterium]